MDAPRAVAQPDKKGERDGCVGVELDVVVVVIVAIGLGLSWPQCRQCQSLLRAGNCDHCFIVKKRRGNGGQFGRCDGLEPSLLSTGVMGSKGKGRDRCLIDHILEKSAS